MDPRPGTESKFGFFQRPCRIFAPRGNRAPFATKRPFASLEIVAVSPPSRSPLPIGAPFCQAPVRAERIPCRRAPRPSVPGLSPCRSMSTPLGSRESPPPPLSRSPPRSYDQKAGPSMPVSGRPGPGRPLGHRRHPGSVLAVRRFPPTTLSLLSAPSDVFRLLAAISVACCVGPGPARYLYRSKLRTPPYICCQKASDVPVRTALVLYPTT